MADEADLLGEDAVGLDDLDPAPAADTPAQRRSRPGQQQKSASAEADELLGEDPITSEGFGADPGEDGDGDVQIGNSVRVIVRVRPLLPNEVERGHMCSQLRIAHEPVTANPSDCNAFHAGAPYSTRSIALNVASKGSLQQFAFDSVLGPRHSQLDVYEAGKVERMLKGVLRGYHATIFAYGQTGAGKTKTMDGIDYSTKYVPIGGGQLPPPGPDGQPNPDVKMKAVRVLKEPSALESGLSLRCINELFGLIHASVSAPLSDAPRQQSHLTDPLPQHTRYTVKCSFIQIYNESVFDLLADSAPAYVSRNDSKSAAAAANAGLRIRWNPQKDFFVENLYIFECKSAKEARNYFLNGMKKRLVASHRMNASSSRSHCIFTLYVEQRNALALDPEQISRSAKLSLVDLAGSERVALTGATGNVLQQSIGINKSLFVLRKVIKALSKINLSAAAPILEEARKTAKSASAVAAALAHVPYRDSTLTRLLKHSLGGNCLTLMVACLNSADAYAEENLSTLNYAALTKKISNNATINEDPKTALIRKLRAEIKLLRTMLARAKQTIVLGGAGAGGGSNLVAQRDGFSRSSGGGGDAKDGGGALLLDGESASSLAEKLIDSVSIMKDLAEDNHHLRELYDSASATVETLELSNVTLNQENDELRDRVHFLETVIVEGQGNEVMKSPNEETTLEGDVEAEEAQLDASMASGPSKAQELLLEVDELRAENEKLRALMVSSEFNNRAARDGGGRGSGTQNREDSYSNGGSKTSRRTQSGPNVAAQPSLQPASIAAFYGFSNTLPHHPPQAPVPSAVARQGVYSSGGSAAVSRPAAVYRPNNQVLQTITSLKGEGRKSRTQSAQRKVAQQSRPVSGTGGSSQDWMRAREAEFDRDRGYSGWDSRPAPRGPAVPPPNNFAYYPQQQQQPQTARPNLAAAAAMNPTIAYYMQQHLQLQQQQGRGQRY